MALIADVINGSLSSVDTNKKRYNSEFVYCLNRNYTALDGGHSTCLQIPSVGHKGYKLNSPILIDIEYANGEYYAKYDKLDIFEYSENLDDLISDVKAYVVDLYDQLTKTENKNLSDDLIKQKRFLKNIITKS